MSNTSPSGSEILRTILQPAAESVRSENAPREAPLSELVTRTQADIKELQDALSDQTIGERAKAVAAAELQTLQLRLEALQQQAREEALHQAEIQAQLALERAQRLAAEEAEAAQRQTAEQERWLTEEAGRERKKGEAMLATVDYLPNSALNGLARFAVETMGGDVAVQNTFVDDWLASRPEVPSAIERTVQMATTQIRQSREERFAKIRDVEVRAKMLGAAKDDPVTAEDLKKTIRPLLLTLSPAEARDYQVAVTKKALAEGLVTTEQAQVAIAVAQIDGNSYKFVVHWLAVKQPRLEYLEHKAKGVLNSENLSPDERSELVDLKEEKQRVERSAAGSGYQTLLAKLPTARQELNKLMEIAPGFAKTEARVRAELQGWKEGVNRQFKEVFDREYLREEVVVEKFRGRIEKARGRLVDINDEVDVAAAKFQEEANFERLPLPQIETLAMSLKMLQRENDSINSGLQEAGLYLKQAFLYEKKDTVTKPAKSDLRRTEDLIDLIEAVGKSVAAQTKTRFGQIQKELSEFIPWSNDLFRYITDRNHSLMDEIRLLFATQHSGDPNEIDKQVSHAATNEQRSIVKQAILDAGNLKRSAMILFGLQPPSFTTFDPGGYTTEAQKALDILYSRVQQKIADLKQTNVDLEQKLMSIAADVKSLERDKQRLEARLLVFGKQEKLNKIDQALAQKETEQKGFLVQREANQAFIQELNVEARKIY